MKKTFFTIVILVGFVMQALAYDFQYGNLLFTIVSTDPPQVSLVGHVDGTAAQGELVIPETLEYDGVTYIVTEIGRCAFRECRKLTGGLHIPGTVSKIEARAFESCTRLDGTLQIPESVTLIDTAAFSGCKSLTGDLIVPNSAAVLGNSAFWGCESLDGILALPDSLRVIPYGAFHSCKGLSGALVIPVTVDSIDFESFYNCCGFSGDLIIPDSVTTLGYTYPEDSSGFWIPNGAFERCYGFDGRLFLPESLQVIPERCFQECFNLQGELSLPPFLTKICEYAFYQCRSFTGNLAIPESVVEIGSRAFGECKGFDGTLFLPSEMTRIGNAAFVDCTGLTGSLNLPQGIMLIDEYTFMDTGFTGRLVIPGSVVRIDRRAFSGCALEKVVLDEALEVVWLDAFENPAMQSMIVKAATPPAVFSGWTELYEGSVSVTVPCGTLEAYRLAEGWSEMPGLTEGLTYHVAVRAESEATGEAFVLKEATCEDPGVEVEAVPNDGCAFLYWEANGERVSEENPYRFELVEDTELVAHFSGAEIGENLHVFSLYPNPAMTQVTIMGTDLKQAEVFNAFGQCVIALENGGDEIILDFRPLPAGIYLVTVTDTEGRKCVKKVEKE